VDDPTFDLCGALRRIRRIADLSQRGLAAAADLSSSVVAHAEAGTRDVHVGALVRAAATAGLRLALVDADGVEVAGMADAAVRDLGRRRFPAHLDVLRSDARESRYEHRFDRPRPWYTYDRDRPGRDAIRRRDGTPDDHRLPQPDDSPAVRRAQRDAAARQRAREDYERRLAAGEVTRSEDFACTCPPGCDIATEQKLPRHTPDCPCGCDLG
jgi:transcriptional regulator with XRE-family HTH domain